MTFLSIHYTLTKIQFIHASILNTDIVLITGNNWLTLIQKLQVDVVHIQHHINFITLGCTQNKVFVLELTSMSYNWHLYVLILNQMLLHIKECICTPNYGCKLLSILSWYIQDIYNIKCLVDLCENLFEVTLDKKY